jgi:hypothetical protein
MTIFVVAFTAIALFFSVGEGFFPSFSVTSTVRKTYVHQTSLNMLLSKKNSKIKSNFKLPKNKTIVPSSDYRAAFFFIFVASCSLVANNPYISLPLIALAVLLAIQTIRVRFVFDEVILSFYAFSFC